MSTNQLLLELRNLTGEHAEKIRFIADKIDPVSTWDWNNVQAELSLEDLYQAALETLGKPEAALVWLTTPQFSIGGLPPILCEDRRSVINILGRIEHGVYS